MRIFATVQQYKQVTAMKITGFSFIKDAERFDYPIAEAISSILPLCDEVVVAVGKSADNTLELVKAIDPEKIRVVETVWDEQLREGGRVLSLETDKAYQAINPETDWAIYIQGDEVIHEKYLPVLKEAMIRYKDDLQVDGLLLKYLHFYGSYDYVGASSKWYAHEIRVLRKNNSFYSYKDAQGFRKGENEKLRVKPVDAYMYHYGWVKPPDAMQRKQENFHKYWHSDDWIKNNVIQAPAYDYFRQIDQLARFEGTHPAVMQNRIASRNWEFAYDLSFNRVPVKEKAKKWLRKYLNLDFSYKNYRIV